MMLFCKASGQAELLRGLFWEPRTSRKCSEDPRGRKIDGPNFSCNFRNSAQFYHNFRNFPAFFHFFVSLSAIFPHEPEMQGKMSSSRFSNVGGFFVCFFCRQFSIIGQIFTNFGEIWPFLGFFLDFFWRMLKGFGQYAD